MLDFFLTSEYFCIMLTIGAFFLGAACQKKWKLAIFNPILIGAGLVMLCITVLKIPVETYQQGCRSMTYLMTPATICLAISFAEQLKSLKKHLPAVCIGVLAGTVSSLGCVALMAKVFGLSRVLTDSLLPKSVTTAIGVALSQQAGGIGAVTTAAIIITGILGNIMGPALSRLLKLRSEVAQGVAYGTASHVIGTSRAVTVSPVVGAVSSLSLTLAGLLTSVIYSVLISM